MRDARFLLQQRAGRLPHMPTRDELLAEAQATFAKTMSLDDIVDRAYELLIESVALFWPFSLSSPWQIPILNGKVAFCAGAPI